jgi:formylmethanofuran dehydrogenase subunit E
MSIKPIKTSASPPEPLNTAALDDLLREAELAHGHLCAGQILGVRMAMLAMQRLGIRDPRRKTLPNGELNPDRKRPVVFVEIDRCATDAIGVVTGARVGKRALKLRDWGKMAATFVDLNARLDADEYGALSQEYKALSQEYKALSQEYKGLRQEYKALSQEYKALRVVALDSSKQRARELYPDLDKNQQQMRAYRELPDAELFSEQWVRVALPPSEFPGYKGERVACALCGEGINFDRFIERDGQRLCLSCAEPERLYFRPL